VYLNLFVRLSGQHKVLQTSISNGMKRIIGFGKTFIFDLPAQKIIIFYEIEDFW
jgi:hypothetical protein